MNISSTQEGVTALVRMAGRLDGEAALQVADTLDRLLRDGRRSVVLDMSGVTYLSSPGTLVLQHAHQEYASAKGELHVASPPPEVAEMLAFAGLLPKLLAGSPNVLESGRFPVDLPADSTRDDWRVPEAQSTRGRYEVSTRDPAAEL